MKKMIKAAAAASALMVLAGCSSPKAETTCSNEANGMAVKMTFSAPDQNSKVDHLEVNASVSLDQLGISPDDISDEYLEMMKDMFKSMISSQQTEGIDPDQVKIELQGDKLVFSMPLDGTQISEITGGNEIPSFKDAVENMKKSGFTCS